MSDPTPTGEPAIGSAIALIERIALDPTVDVERLERLLAFQERLFAKQAEIDFLEAKARIKKKLADVRIIKIKPVMYDIDKNNKSRGQAEAFKYCPLDEIDRYVAPLLAAEDMDLSFTTRPRAGDGGGAVIVGRLRHVKGHWEESEIPLPLDATGGKSNIQAMGSTNSYGRRYVICNIFNIVVVGDDDDGMGGPIDEAQVANLRDLLTKANRTEAQFLRYMRAEAIEQIAYKDYPKAVSALQERIRPK
jgi:hypothetical protein